MKLDFLNGLQRCLYASDTRTPQVPMRGEKTGRRSRQEVNGRAVGLNRELQIKQVDGEIAWELIGGEILIARIESSGSSRNICSK